MSWYLLQWLETLAVWVPCFLVWMTLWIVATRRGRRAARRAVLQALLRGQNRDNVRLSPFWRRGGGRYDAA